VSGYSRLRVLIPPKARGLDYYEHLYDSALNSAFEPEVIEFERSPDGFLRCAECKGDKGISENTPTEYILHWHLEEHRANQKEIADQKKILAILEEAYRQIALIKGENK